MRSGAGYIARHAQKKRETACLPRPSEDLELVLPNGAILRTAQAVVVGHRISVNLVGYFLMKSASGLFFLQSEDPVKDKFKAKYLTRQEAITCWNACSSKLSATALLGE